MALRSTSAGNHADAGRGCPLPQAVELALGDGDEPPAARELGGSRPGQLTQREMEVASLAGDGLSNREIAARMDISKRTVDAHVTHIYAKLGLSSRVGLAVWMRRQELCGVAQRS